MVKKYLILGVFSFYLIVHDEMRFIHPGKTRCKTATVEPNNHCNVQHDDWLAEADADAEADAEADADEHQQHNQA